MVFQGRLSIDGWLVDPDTHRMTRDGAEIKLEPRSMELLVYLAERPDQVISREQIEANVWHGQVVGYEALSGSIAKLRKAFGDTDKNHRIIETISKSGYRLLATVVQADPAPEITCESVDTPPAGAKPSRSIGGAVILVVIVAGLVWWQPWIAREEPASVERMAFPLPDKPSIAILPFTNMSDDPEQRYFADGMTDDLITDLSKISGLFVIARNSVFTYKDKAVKIGQVAEELGVRYVMEGSVRRAGDQVRINAQLIDATTGGHLWAERYDGHFSDIFALQDRVTLKIVTALAINMTAEDQTRQANRQKTTSPQAYDEFLKARKAYLKVTRVQNLIAGRHLEAAIKLDPTYIGAHALLAAVCYQAWENEWAGAEAKVKAEHHLKEAMKNPTPLAHLITTKLLVDQEQWGKAIAEAQRGIDLDPNDPNGYTAMGYIYSSTGRPQQAVNYLSQALRLDPVHPDTDLLCQLGMSQFQLGLLEESAFSLERSIAYSPGHELAYPALAAIYGLQGREQDARDMINAFDKLGVVPANLEEFIADRFSSEKTQRSIRHGLRKVGLLV